MIKFSTAASPIPHPPPPPPPPPYPPSPFPDASFLSQYCVAPLKYTSHHCIILFCCKKLLTSKKEAGYLTRFPPDLPHPTPSQLLIPLNPSFCVRSLIPPPSISQPERNIYLKISPYILNSGHLHFRHTHTQYSLNKKD